ncbi:unnamed protein product [Clavelina lepadiformis]|uniref:Uncharacterized protein n=1 Tax=Clavelina lepadiformis TaxID=159417 RepID=A0ABP0GAB9_CLALP
MLDMTGWIETRTFQQTHSVASRLNPGIGQSVGVHQQVVNDVYEWEKYDKFAASCPHFFLWMMLLKCIGYEGNSMTSQSCHDCDLNKELVSLSECANKWSTAYMSGRNVRKETQPQSGRQLIVVSSEKQAKVLTLPSQVCIHSLTLPPDNGCLMKSNVDISSHGARLACFSSSGNVLCPLVGYDL